MAKVNRFSPGCSCYNKNKDNICNWSGMAGYFTFDNPRFPSVIKNSDGKYYIRYEIYQVLHSDFLYIPFDRVEYNPLNNFVVDYTKVTDIIKQYNTKVYNVTYINTLFLKTMDFKIYNELYPLTRPLGGIDEKYIKDEFNEAKITPGVTFYTEAEYRNYLNLIDSIEYNYISSTKYIDNILRAINNVIKKPIIIWFPGDLLYRGDYSVNNNRYYIDIEETVDSGIIRHVMNILPHDIILYNYVRCADICKYATITERQWLPNVSCNVIECRCPTIPQPTNAPGDISGLVPRRPANVPNADYYEVRSKYCNERYCRNYMARDNQ